jgi:hypothetical protein
MGKGFLRLTSFSFILSPLTFSLLSIPRLRVPAQTRKMQPLRISAASRIRQIPKKL